MRAQTDAKRVKRGTRRTPKTGARNPAREFACALADLHVEAPLPHGLPAAVEDLRAHFRGLAYWVSPSVHVRRFNPKASVRARCDVYRAQVQACLDLDLDALPKAAGLDVPILLSVRDLGVFDSFDLVRFCARIGDAHCQLVLSRMEQRSNVKLNRQITAFVRTELLPVEVNLSAIVHGAKPHQRDLPRRQRGESE